MCIQESVGRISSLIRSFILSVFCFVSGLFPASGQSIISGQVTDNTNKALPQATVQLISTSDTSHTIKMVDTDSTGYYRFNAPQPGAYFIFISHLGYHAAISDTIKVNKTEIHIHMTLLRKDSNLATVIVKAARPRRMIHDGKIVFDVQTAANSGGQTALEIISKLPGISLDQNENIALRGLQGVTILLDGKATYLSGAPLVNFLKGLNAADISGIEFINAPQASNDAAGSAGIVNILLKKRNNKGFALDLRSSISKGRYFMTNHNLGIGFRSKKLNTYGSFDYNTPHRYIANAGTQSIPGNPNLNAQRDAHSGYKINYYTWRAGVDWQVAPKHKIGLNYHGYLDDFSCFHITAISLQDQKRLTQSSTLSSNTIIEPYHYDAVNTSYLYLADSLGKKITADIDLTYYRNYSDAFMQLRYYEGEGGLTGTNKLKSYQPGFVKIQSYKTDLELPLKSFLLKAGLKYAHASNDNRYQFDSLKNGIYQPIDEVSDHFKYTERVAASYLSAHKTFNKTAIAMGLRLEHTHADGYTLKQGTLNRWQYTQLFPSLSIERMLLSDQQLTLAITRRINRPSYTNLNPVRWYRDPYFYFSGNPVLMPELSWVFTAVYQYRRKYTFSLNYNKSRHFIAERLAVDESGAVIKSQSANFGNMDRLDATLYAPLQVLKNWTLQFTATGSYMRYPLTFIAGEHNVSRWSTQISLQQDIALPWSILANFNAYYYSKQPQGVFITDDYYFLEAGLKKSFLNNQLAVQLFLTDFFDSKKTTVRSATDFIHYVNDGKPDSRRAGLSISWSILGKLKNSHQKRTEEQERL